MSKVEIEFQGEVKIRVGLRQPPTETVRRMMASLPFGSRAHRWGEEVYFEAPFHSDREEDARTDMAIGEVAYWPDGDAIAIFFGPTPVSEGPMPRAYSACNPIGRVEGDLSALRTVRESTVLQVRKL